MLTEMRNAEHRVSKATIYRTLKHLLDAGIVTEVLIDSRHTHYELSFGRQQKGHLVCLETNRIIEFPTPELNELRDQICRKHGFNPVSYRFVIYGIDNDIDQDNGEVKESELKQ